LLHDVDAPLLTVNVESDKALAYAGSQLLAMQNRRGAKKITRGGNGHAAADDALDEVAPGERLQNAFFGPFLNWL
jgi:hypothetical protein